jgi:microcystin-dependent protein
MNPLLGEIKLFAGNYAPKGWALCEGQLLEIRTNTALFSIFGTEFGGNGTETFALPDLRSKPPLHGKGVFIIALEGVYPSRA